MHIHAHTHTHRIQTYTDTDTILYFPLSHQIIKLFQYIKYIWYIPCNSCPKYCKVSRNYYKSPQKLVFGTVKNSRNDAWFKPNVHVDERNYEIYHYYIGILWIFDTKRGSTSLRENGPVPCHSIWGMWWLSGECVRFVTGRHRVRSSLWAIMMMCPWASVHPAVLGLAGGICS
jgi:hypothetical protein